MSNIVEGKFKAQKPEIVWSCEVCDEQKWLLLEEGRIKCHSCGNRFVLPHEFVEQHNKWEVKDE